MENMSGGALSSAISNNTLILTSMNRADGLFDGEIDVRSIPNEYTEFEVFLPDKELTDIGIIQKSVGEQLLLPTEPLLKDQLKLQELNKDKQTIFVIDDDPNIRWYISDMLSEQYNVVSIENPLSVCKMLKTIQPRLIVSDIMMPEMDGITLMKQIKADSRTAHIPFILLSAKNTPEEQAEGIRNGAEAYVVKPFNNKYFQSVIERLLQRQDVLKNYYRSVVSAYEFTDGKFIHKENKMFFEKVLLTIERNMTNPNFTADCLAIELGLSARSLYRKLSDITEKTPANLIKEYRLFYVEKLLLTTKHSVDEIMYKAGFNHRGSFYRLFTQKFGVTPKNYREMKIENEIKQK
jgi:CheY-like chemotaxis protein/methylphosphotriester-DNA--protein-cysteine methyltransferase